MTENVPQIFVILQLIHDPLPCNNAHSMFRFIFDKEIVTLSENEDKLLDKATDVLGEIESRNINNYNLIHKSKALIHKWLA